MLTSYERRANIVVEFSAPMNVRIHGIGDIEVEEGAAVDSLIERFDFHKDMVIVLLNNVPTPIDQPLKDGDALKIIKVVSGG